jgi:hypothetical protein
MRRILTIIIFFISFTSSSLNAQTQPNNIKRAKQIESIKIGYITRRLELTPEESQKFWPVYNQFQLEQNQIIQQKRKARLQNANNPDQMIDDDFHYDTKILELKKSYRKEFSKIISPEKIKSLYTAERDFREELIKQLKNRSENGN